MILRSIRAEGLGCFADSLTAGPFTSGINVVYAPNGTGKSTLLRAVTLAFLEPHRGKSADVQALRPWGRRLSPQVGVEFEHANRMYRIRKRFLDGSSAHVETREGENWTSFAQGDNADEFLRELLQSESDKPRSGKREYWGLAQVLWTTQGDLSLPPLASSVIESIRGSVGAQLAGRDSAIDARVNEEYLKYFSPTRGKLKSGRNAAPLSRLEMDRDRLQGEVLTAQDLLRQFESESEKIEKLRATETALAARREGLAKELESARAQAEEYKKLRSEQRERAALRDGAQSRHKALAERVEAIERARRQIQTSGEALTGLSRELPQVAVELEAAQKAAGEADLACRAAASAEEAARERLRVAQSAGEYLQAAAEDVNLTRRLAESAAGQAAMAAAMQRKAALNAPTEAQLRELRAALAKETDARRRLDLARITVGFVPETGIEVEVIAGERPGKTVCRAGERMVLAGAPSLMFAIPGVGRFEANGPVGDYQPVREELNRQEAWIGSFSRQFGSSDPEAMEARRREAAELDAKVRETRRSITKLLDGNSEAGLRDAQAECLRRMRVIEAEHPDWASLPPDTATLMAAANASLANTAAVRNQAETSARAAHRRAGEAQTRLKLAAERQAVLQEQLDQARRVLEGYLADGLHDEGRRKLVEQAVLEYDACRIALQQIEDELRRFEQDPALAVNRISKEIGNVQGQAERAKDERLCAETRIRAVVERRPYAACNEISERLAVSREQIEREQRRMEALALLHQTLEEVRSEVMAAVAAPVERIASDYFEEICGRAIAEIRLSPSLAGERVIPAALADEPDPGVEVDRLSGGEREQIFFCTRIALGSELARRERQMVVLDDVLAFTDDERMERICRLLSKVEDRLQLIVLTCHPERFAGLPGANRIDLAAATSCNKVGAYV